MDGEAVMPTTAVLDVLVFDFAFDIVDIAPVILRVQLDRQYYRVSSGQSVPVTLYIIDNSTTPNRRFMFTPPEGPFITIYNPVNTVVVNAVQMPQREQGVFTYICPTTTYTILGLYSAIFTATNGAEEMVSKKYGLFTLI